MHILLSIYLNSRIALILYVIYNNLKATQRVHIAHASSVRFLLIDIMASWEASFRKGVIAFRTSKYEKALEMFDEVLSWPILFIFNFINDEWPQAIANGGELYNVYDSRAAALEKLGKIKPALRDSRRVIELAPEMRHVGCLREKTRHDSLNITRDILVLHVFSWSWKNILWPWTWSAWHWNASLHNTPFVGRN